jgi:hypothetical protein
MMRRNLIAAGLLLAAASPAMAGFPAATFRACADVLPEYRERLLSAAQRMSNPGVARLPTDAFMRRTYCLAVAGEALLGAAGEDSYTAPGNVERDLERSYPGIAPR